MGCNYLSPLVIFGVVCVMRGLPCREGFFYRLQGQTRLRLGSGRSTASFVQVVALNQPRKFDLVTRCIRYSVKITTWEYMLRRTRWTLQKYRVGISCFPVNPRSLVRNILTYDAGLVRRDDGVVLSRGRDRSVHSPSSFESGAR